MDYSKPQQDQGQGQGQGEDTSRDERTGTCPCTSIEAEVTIEDVVDCRIILVRQVEFPDFAEHLLENPHQSLGSGVANDDDDDDHDHDDDKSKKTLNEEGTPAAATTSTKEHALLPKKSSVAGLKSASNNSINIAASNKARMDGIWNKHLTELKQYKEINGHVSVPRKSGPLGEWTRTQRRYYKEYRKGETVSLTKQRIKALEGLGFVWFPMEAKKRRDKEPPSLASIIDKDVTANAQVHVHVHVPDEVCIDMERDSGADEELSRDRDRSVQALSTTNTKLHSAERGETMKASEDNPTNENSATAEVDTTTINTETEAQSCGVQVQVQVQLKVNHTESNSDLKNESSHAENDCAVDIINSRQNDGSQWGGDMDTNNYIEIIGSSDSEDETCEKTAAHDDEKDQAATDDMMNQDQQEVISIDSDSSKDSGYHSLDDDDEKEQAGTDNKIKQEEAISIDSDPGEDEKPDGECIEILDDSDVDDDDYIEVVGVTISQEARKAEKARLDLERKMNVAREKRARKLTEKLMEMNKKQSFQQPNYSFFVGVKRTATVLAEENDPRSHKKPASRSNRTIVDDAYSESAFVEQERLFRESAARVKAQEGAQRLLQTVRGGVQFFSQAVQDVRTLPKDHFKWSDPYSRLGVPRKSSYEVVKRNYRKLCLLYHPDKSQCEDAPDRFQGIKEAYEEITESLGT